MFNRCPSLTVHFRRFLAVRVRPPLDPSDPGFDLIPHRFRGSTCHVGNPTSLTVESSQGKKLFVFDRVFSDKEEQGSVWEYVSESVNSFVQGYNVSLLAYGQSGAGKSYTMGTSGPGEQMQPKRQGQSSKESLREGLSCPIILIYRLGGSLNPCSRHNTTSGD